MARTDRTEYETRIEMLLGLKAQGYAYSRLIQVGIQHWQVSARQMKRYLAEVNCREKALSTLSLMDHVGRSMNQYRYLYSKAVQNNDLQLALKIKADEVQAFATYARHSGTGEKNNATLSAAPSYQPAELEKLLAELETDRLTY